MAHPDWTDVNDSDPGVPLLELLAWLATGLLLFRAARRRAASRRARRAQNLP